MTPLPGIRDGSKNRPPDAASLNRLRAEVGERLRAVIPAAAVLTELEQLRPFECDGLSAHRQPPLAVAMPANVDQVQAVLKVCREAGVPVVTRGAGTGLSGGALPLAGGVLLNMSRMNDILSLIHI